MTKWEDPTCHPGCENERGADGHHRSQFCVFCLRAIGDKAQLRVAKLEDVLRRISKLEETHENWDDAVFDAMKWAREALKESETTKERG